MKYNIVRLADTNKVEYKVFQSLKPTGSPSGILKLRDIWFIVSHLSEICCPSALVAKEKTV